MKRAMVISILYAVMLTACGNVSESAESAETSAVSQTATTVTGSAVTSAKEEKDTSETTTTTKKSSQTVSETSKAKTTTKSAISSSTVNTKAPQEQNELQSYPQTEQPQENTQVNTTQKPAVTTTQQKQTTAKQTATAPPKPAATTQKPQTTPQPTTTTKKPSTTKPQETVQWSDTMKAWRKLCEGKSINGAEWELVREDIVSYGMQKFNGKTTVELNCGIDLYTRTFQSPLNLTENTSLKGLSHAHLDAYTDADSRWLIDYAGNEEEVYRIVEQSRADCLTVIDIGLESWYEFCEVNDCLKYASSLEFNVGLDGTAIWFLTED